MPLAFSDRKGQKSQYGTVTCCTAKADGTGRL